MESYQGGCLCGRVRFALSGPPMMAACCHCSICRRWTGAAFSMVGFWAPERTEVTAGSPLLARATSSHLTRHRCPECGTPIYNAVRSERLQSNNFMLALLAPLADEIRPTCHIYYADRIADVADDLVKHDRFRWSPRAG